MKLIIKNMVCPRCTMTVEQLLAKNGLKATAIHLGEVELAQKPGKQVLTRFAADLQQMGFELLDDQRMQIVEQVKTLIISKVQSADIEEHFSVSKYLTAHIYKDYSYISKLFSEVEGVTIEQYLILQKTEKVKELLIYNEQSLSQIAASLGYSSPQHLSAQFRRLTGMTPSQFKQLGASHRKPLDSVKS